MAEAARREDLEIVFVRLFRLWAIAREDGSQPLSRMHQVAAELCLPDETAIACASLFELVAGELGRPLVRECCCSKEFSADERALLGIVEVAPNLKPGSGSTDVPHGLPGAIHWAAMAVRRAFGLTGRPVAFAPASSRRSPCPFERPASKISGSRNARLRRPPTAWGA